MIVATVEIDAGACGHAATVRATRTDGLGMVAVSIDSTCPDVQSLASEMGEVNAYRSIDLRAGLPPVLELAYHHCRHAACPVPTGLVKCIEVAAGLALPRDVSMRISAEDYSEER